jgi:hypothetical protein
MVSCIKKFLYQQSYRRLMISTTKIPLAIFVMLAICFTGAFQAYASSDRPGSAPPASGETDTTKQASDEDVKGTDSPPPEIFTRILYDDENGKNNGWDPNSRSNTFLINESRVDRLLSTVLVNTHQYGQLICGTDWIVTGFFEIHCTKPPPEGAQLLYTVINAGRLQAPTPDVTKEIGERYSNLSNGTSYGPTYCQFTKGGCESGDNFPYYPGS